VARALIPLALVSILAACGGATQKEAASSRVLHGTDFSFSVPKAWRSTVSAGIVRAASGRSEVSVQTFSLLKPYRPEEFAAVTKELDRDAEHLAAQAGRPLTSRETTTVAGMKIRAYRYGATRIGFVLVGRREYQLLCRLGSGGSDPDGACALLFSSFSLS
jgi:hypothetical protein